MNVGIVGAGYMGSMHARLLKSSTQGTLAGITSKSNVKAYRLAQELNIKCYADYSAMLTDRDIDIIDICTPTATHEQMAVSAIKAGKHVIIEFPVCANESELFNIFNYSQKYQRHCAVAYYSRFQSQYKYVFELAKSGSLGTITSLTISRRTSPVFACEDIVNDLISQDIDFMVNLLGLPKSSLGKNIKNDYACFLFEYDGCIAFIEGASNQHESYPFTTKHIISGDKACIDLTWSFKDQPYYKMYYSDRDSIKEITNEDYDPYRYELEQILTGLKDNKTAGFDLASVIDTAQLTFFCRQLLK